MKEPRSKTTQSQAPIPDMAPLHWGTWPTQEVPLTLEGQRGKWAFVQPWPCGSWEAILVVPWHMRTASDAPRHVVAATEVFVPLPVTKQKSRVAQRITKNAKAPAPASPAPVKSTKRLRQQQAS